MTFTFKGTGRLKRVDKRTTANGKTVITLVCETDGRFPQVVPVKVFGRLAEKVGDWKPGMVLGIEGTVGGKEWNDKVFSDVLADAVVVVDDKGVKKGEWDGGDADKAPGDVDDDLPF